MDKLFYTVNGRRVRIKPSEFMGKYKVRDYAKQICTALNKIGVEDRYIKIDCGGIGVNSWAMVDWVINNKTFHFRCDSQMTQPKNMGSIAQALQDDVRHITRGIKDLWASMRQYDALPSPDMISSKSAYDSLDRDELKRLMLLHHPDQAGDNFNEAKFRQIKDALERKKLETNAGGDIP